ncbi:hypothetical protein GHT06_011149 [Daphnia sinensis]|uniref:Uncharacterized protein n=1 Tax=Daphnia sinensis TaxID=1820382 RepID=A0AAD5Q1U6_9CRUS|nr:hypothetical protein GHT06_011149 [Daphnia sinensis]
MEVYVDCDVPDTNCNVSRMSHSQQAPPNCYILLSSDVLQFGLPGNESWSGVLGKLARKEADMTISFGPVSYPRFLSFDTTVGIFRDHVVIMIPYPESGIDASGLVSIFSPFVHLPTLSLLPLTNLWLLALIVLTYAYTGTLISRLTAPKHRFVINSLEDAAANKEILPYVVKESSVQEEFMLSPIPSFQQIANRWQDHPELLLRDSNGIVDLVAKQKNRIFIGV